MARVEKLTHPESDVVVPVHPAATGRPRSMGSATRLTAPPLRSAPGGRLGRSSTNLTIGPERGPLRR
jgi:hypothetical protein